MAGKRWAKRPNICLDSWHLRLIALNYSQLESRIMLVARKKLLLWSLLACTSPIVWGQNYFKNPSFEEFSEPHFGMGVLTNDWVVIANSPITFSANNAFGVPPSFNDWFTGATGHAGNNWVGCRTSPGAGEHNPDMFGQAVPSGLKSNVRYRVGMWVRQPAAGIFANPARYQLWFWRPNGVKTLLSTLLPSEGFSFGWKYRWAAATMPSLFGIGNGLVFAPIETKSTNAGCPGIDDVSLIIASTDLSGEVSMPGTPSDGEGMGLQLILCNPGDSEPIETIDSSIGNSGTFSVTSAAPDGTYDLIVRGETTLKRRVKEVEVKSGAAANINVTLVNGDCDGDNFIGTDDYLILNSTFDKSLGDSGYDARADLDGDDYVGTNDYLILNANFDRSGDN